MTAIQERSRARGEALAALERSTEWNDDDFSDYRHIALEWGKRYCAMTEEWAQWAQEQITARRPRESGREATG